MKKLKNKLGKIVFTSFALLSLIGVPWMVLAEEGETPTPSPSPTIEPTPTPPPVKKETKLELDKTNIELTVGESTTITATVTGEEGIDTDVTWDTDKKDIISVSKGTVKALKTGTATITVKANADENVVKTCTVTVKEAKKLSNDTTLDGLQITGAKITPAFSPNVEKYTLELTSETTRPNIEPKSKKGQKVIISPSLNDLKVSDFTNGKEIRIVVTAEDGKTNKTYKLIVSSKEETSLNLKTLKVKGYTLNEAFAPNRTGYTVDIPYEAEDVTIELATESDDVKTEIKGATNLKVGKNEVTITVKNSNGEKKTYTITVTRAAKEDDNEKEDSHVTSHKTSTSALLSEETNYPSHTLKYILVTIGCLILFAIGGIGIYFYVKTSVKDKKNKTTKDKEKIKEEIKDSDSGNAMIEVAPEKKETKEIFVETREFNFEKDDLPVSKKESEELNVLEEIEDLFDDE